MHGSGQANFPISPLKPCAKNSRFLACLHIDFFRYGNVPWEASSVSNFAVTCKRHQMDAELDDVKSIDKPIFSQVLLYFAAVFLNEFLMLSWDYSYCAFPGHYVMFP